ncbi:flagellar hook capping FlgD N-terminal domain-containing protein [Pandoraea pulmonicola]|uniref:flagellar hook capping FlgD N-terminal domain-containing protein n=1 Tax=Pandoraea pulmonicola TaxID=93221 RepID=UPI001357A346|nr:flagellar hook capping FlgD N-terminal domain-containing protein [Pandoraea pulmonicola]
MPGIDSGAGGDSNLFVKLLVAQMRNQDPLNPQDPSQFVSQLTQLSQLDAMQGVMKASLTNAAKLESMMVVSLGSQVGNAVKVKAGVVELEDGVVKGSVELGKSATDVAVVLTGPDGREHRMSLGAHTTGEVDFEIDPQAQGLKPGKYKIKVVTDTAEKPDAEIEGKLEGVRVGADGKVILQVAGVGPVDTAAVTSFLGKPANFSSPKEFV